MTCYRCGDRVSRARMTAHMAAHDANDTKVRRVGPPPVTSHKWSFEEPPVTSGSIGGKMPL